MAEQSPDMLDANDDLAPVEAVEAAREISDSEKKLRRDVARYREQARIAISERDAACAAAVRDRDEAVAAAREEARHRVLHAELKTHAIRAGIVDLDGLRLADTSPLAVDDSGAVQGIDEVIAKLRQNKPYLFGGDVPAPAVVTTAQLQRPPAPAQPAVLDARNLSKEAWQAERERLLSTHR